MILQKYELLDKEFHNDDVKKYYSMLETRKVSIAVKRVFDFFVSLIMTVFFLPVFLILALAIKLDSKGPVLFRQERVTTYGKVFRIYKFRTMVANAESLGTQVTVNNDMRVTRVGRVLRKYRLDETPQLFNILKGEMSFVGTRPEVPRYVDSYTDDMYATLLLPAGVTSLASIFYKDEERLLSESENANETYIEKILPEKMKYNLKYIESFSFWNDIKLMLMTVVAVIKKEEEQPAEEVKEVTKV